ncbi:FAD-dependent oxidoreductase domain-containing protein 2 [Rhinatrema bivittatum]|uniref:FAD-dependent oxidoreductase domain-containing protein 2 n=1 Tax=Rhinatrema bivittatum TaxID=194408 RepID=UPI00112D14B3|nr:FAD-dependent oxidoreductase domain-containing protein 2 [Rhinatrema bivittatum]
MPIHLTMHIRNVCWQPRRSEVIRRAWGCRSGWAVAVMPQSQGRYRPLLLLVLALWMGWAGATSSPRHQDYCIIGAGPSGLQMAYFLQQSGRDYVIFERSNSSGSFFHLYPRHRKLLSINKRYTGLSNREFNLRHDWNSLLSHTERLLFRHHSQDFYPHADAMVRYLNYFSTALGLRVQYNTNITRVQLHTDLQAWNGHYFLLRDQNGQSYRCSVLLVATGMWIPNMLNVPGAEYMEGYESVSVDPADFAGQSVLILGRGNSAFETAENILGVTNFLHMVGRSRVRLSWATHYVGDLRAINNGLLDTYQLKSLNGLLEGNMEEMAIVRDEEGKLRITLKIYVAMGGHYNSTSPDNGSQQSAKPIALPQDEMDNFAARKPYDRIIRCLGWKFDFSIFDKTVNLVSGAGRKRKYPLIRPSYEAQATPGLFVLGTASHSIDFQESAGAFIHGFRYTTRAVHHLLEQRYHGVPWPSVALPISQLANTIVKRVNEASGLYQMFGVLADIVLLREDSRAFEYLEEYPIRILPELEKHTGKEVQDGLFVVTLEYGKNFSGPEKDVFYNNRAVGEAQHAWQSNFLHPIIYFYRHLPTEQMMKLRPKGWPLPRPDAIHHMVEDFHTDWTAPNAHILPLRRFLENCLDTDLRAFFAESCFLFALTNRKSPPFCQQGYLRMQGLVGNQQLRHHAVDAGLLEDYATLEPAEEQADRGSHDLPGGHMAGRAGDQLFSVQLKEEL